MFFAETRYLITSRNSSSERSLSSLLKVSHGNRGSPSPTSRPSWRYVGLYLGFESGREVYTHIPAQDVEDRPAREGVPLDDPGLDEGLEVVDYCGRCLYPTAADI